MSTLCEGCIEKVKNVSNSNEDEPLENEEENDTSQLENTVDDESINDIDTLTKIKNLELELARVKLELVDAQCKNQELDHSIKSLKNGDISASTVPNNVNSKHSDQLGIMSSSTSSLNQNTPSMANSPTQTATNLNGSNNSINNNTNGNNWLSKTFTQFKQATNQVVQKAQKVNSTMSFDANNN